MKEGSILYVYVSTILDLCPANMLINHISEVVAQCSIRYRDKLIHLIPINPSSDRYKTILFVSVIQIVTYLGTVTTLHLAP